MKGNSPRRIFSIPLSRNGAIAACFALSLSALALVLVVRFSLGNGSPASPSEISIVTSLGYLGLFALIAIDSASIPTGGEFLIPFSGYLVYVGVMNYATVLLVVTAAGVTGSLADYYVARRFGRPFVEGFMRKFGVQDELLGRAERLFKGKGSWIVFPARCIPVIRSLISIPAGLFKMPLLSFFLLTLLGFLTWNAVLIFAGYSAGALWEKVTGLSTVIVVDGVLAVIAVASAIYLIAYLYRRPARIVG